MYIKFSAWEPVRKLHYFEYDIQNYPLQLQVNNTPFNRVSFDIYRRTQNIDESYFITVELKVQTCTNSVVTFWENGCEWRMEVESGVRDKKQEVVVWTFWKTDATISVVNQRGKSYEFW